MQTAADLPALEGTPKQIAWAEDIRRSVLESIHQRGADVIVRTPSRSRSVRYHDGSGLLTAAGQIAADRAQAILRAVVTRQVAASWWIDHRSLANPPRIPTQPVPLGAEDRWGHHPVLTADELAEIKALFGDGA